MKQTTAFVLTGLFVLILSGIASAAEATGGSSAGMVPVLALCRVGSPSASACAAGAKAGSGRAMESSAATPIRRKISPVILSLGPSALALRLISPYSRARFRAINRHDADRNRPAGIVHPTWFPAD